MKLTETTIPVVEMSKEEYYALTYSPLPQSIGTQKIVNILPDGKELMLDGEKFYRLIIIKWYGQE